MGYEYIIDFTIPDLVKSILRNIIYNREDDILGNNVKSRLSSNNANVSNTNFNPVEPSKDKSEIKIQEANKNVNNSASVSQAATVKDNFFDNFNPYDAPTSKEFFSPMSEIGQKLLSEDNIFNEEFLINVYTDVFSKLNEKMK
jgi:hypothetical protein